MEKCRVLTIINDLDRCNGITSFVMNYYRELDTSKIQMDFVITSNNIDEEYKKSIEQKKGKIHIIEFRNKKLLKDKKMIKEFMKCNASNYDIVHSHLINKGYFYLKYAKKYGIKTRILHSHNPALGENGFVRNIVNHVFKALALKYTNTYFACSNLAGKALFGNNKFIVINNAFDLENYSFDEKKRNNLRKKLNLDDNIVILQVGRLYYPKNPKFSIDLLEKIKKEIPNIKLVFAGTGQYQDELKKMVEDKNLKNDVIFLGVRNDINELYMASDLLVFPSEFEGLGLVAVEAQISGLPCYISDEVPKETKIIDTTKYMKLDINLWKKVIIDTYKNGIRGDYSGEAVKYGYDIKTEVKKLEEIYLKLR